MNQFDHGTSDIVPKKAVKALIPFALGAACGAATMFLWDPSRGKWRRALLQDQIVSLKKSASRKISRLNRDLQNRLVGLISRLQSPTTSTVDDITLERRVRSVFGRVIRHPRSIKTSVAQGVVTVSGPILADEVSNILNRIRSVPGVHSIVNKLDVYETSKGVSSLQGDGPEYLQ